ncbi:MAG: sigma-70 family RNA polymerase sigma factor [Thermomicrobiales bacterium]
MDEHDWLAVRFEENRGRLRAMAYRMLGSASEADDAVQESWLRLSQSGANDVDNLGGWLTTVVARVCLDMLRSRKSRREEPFDFQMVEATDVGANGFDPEHEALLADAVGPALLVILETLAPAERLAFVMHDMFGVPFDEISSIVGRTPTATRKLASRARRRVQGVSTTPEADNDRQRTIVDAFLAASRNGDFDALLALLDPDVVLHADDEAAGKGAPREVRGAVAVAETFSGRARVAKPALVNGSVGAVWAQEGRPRVAFGFTIMDGKIVEIGILANPAVLRQTVVADLD